MGKTILTAENVSKTYWKPGGNSGKGEHLEVLKNLNFTLEEGEIMGLIGGNGAGKSTLLKILSQIVAPTSGKITYEGRATSILDIGTGFHPDLSGRENIFFNGALRGFSRSEIKHHFDSIVEFSGIGDFIESPVKHYSAGMYLRLAFSTAFHFPLELLFLDEVIAVGDAEFRSRSLDRLIEVVKQGATVVVASHQINDIQYLASRCMYLKQGDLVKVGEVNEVVETYIGSLPAFSGSQMPEFENDWVKMLDIEVRSKGKQAGETLYMDEDIEIVIRFLKKKPEHAMEVGLHLYDMTEFWIMMDSIGLSPDYKPVDMPIGEYESIATIPKNTLNRGFFSFRLNFSLDARANAADIPKAGSFKVEARPLSKMAELPVLLNAPIVIRLDWKVNPV